MKRFCFLSSHRETFADVLCRDQLRPTELELSPPYTESQTPYVLFTPLCGNSGVVSKCMTQAQIPPLGKER